MEREKFEESWKKAFEQAEVSPSDQVWTNIELDLEKAKGGELKRRLMFYQMLAAASVVFAMAIGGIGYYQLSGNEAGPHQIASRQAAVPADTQEHAASPSGDASTERLANEQAATADNSPTGEGSKEGSVQHQPSLAESFSGDHSTAGTAIIEQRARKNSESVPPGVSAKDEPPHIAAGTAQTEMIAALPQREVSQLPLSLQERSLPPLFTPSQINLNFPEQKQEVDPVLAMLANLEQRENEIRGEEKNEKDENFENLWTSVGFAAGSFTNVQAAASNPASGPSPASYSLTAPIVDQETKASGYSYSMGVNVGTRISERWVLQGGVNYLTHASEYTANNVVATSSGYQQQRFRAISTNELINANVDELNSKIVYSAPYNVNNSMRYLSIPMQAGYLLVNKTFGLQLNAGVATDLFLQNTIKADSDHLEKTSQSAGSDSPYRAVNLSGLVGTELSYRFSENYRISLNPGVRYPFNTIYKSELGVGSTPLTFDIGLRFRYIFR